MSLETQREPVSKVRLTHNTEIYHSVAAPGNWADGRGAALPSSIQYGNGADH